MTPLTLTPGYIEQRLAVIESLRQEINLAIEELKKDYWVAANMYRVTAAARALSIFTSRGARHFIMNEIAQTDEVHRRKAPSSR